MAKMFKKFVQSLQSCPSELQAKAIAIIRDLSADPINAATWHTLAADSRALSPDVYKARLNDSYRLVLHRITKPRLEWIPVLAAKHEVVDRFVVRYQPVLDAEERITVLPAAQPSQESPTSQARYAVQDSGLFDAWANSDLVSVGVPKEAIAVVREVRSVEHVDQLGGKVPSAAFDTLLDWATAPTERERLAILGLAAGTHHVADESALAAAVSAPENYEEVIGFEDPSELGELLEKSPLEDWMVFLHPDQKSIVERDFNGPARIRGISGSGKTVILVHRARRLARTLCKIANDRILVLTHNRVLASLLKDRLLPKLCGPELFHIEVDTIHGWAAQFLEGPHVKFEEAERCLREAIESVREEFPQARILDRPVAFFQEEISQVIRGRLLKDLEAYSELQRRGRGTPLNTEQRKVVWRVFEEYVRIRGRNKVLDADDILQGALYKLVGPEESGLSAEGMGGWALLSGATGHNYKAVLVDETQDLTEMGLRLVYGIAGNSENSLFLVGDGLQKIYRGGFSLKRLGIEISGRSLVLKKNFRNTRAIMAAAYALVSDVEFEDFDEAGKTQTFPPDLSSRIGEKPIICKCSALDSEAAWVAVAIKDLTSRLRLNLTDIGVLYRGEPYRAAIESHINKAGIPTVFHREDAFLSSEDAVRVSTIHSTKGMEFKVVFILGLTERVFPWAGIDPYASTEEEKQAHVELQRRLLYVAMTRARDLLFLSYPMRDKKGHALQPSRFLSQIGDFCNFVDASRENVALPAGG